MAEIGMLQLTRTMRPGAGATPCWPRHVQQLLDRRRLGFDPTRTASLEHALGVSGDIKTLRHVAADLQPPDRDARRRSIVHRVISLGIVHLQPFLTVQDNVGRANHGIVDRDPRNISRVMGFSSGCLCHGARQIAL